MADQIQFGQRIRNPEIVLAKLQGLTAAKQTQITVLRPPGRRQHTHPPIFPVLPGFEMPHPEKDQIGRHARRPFETHPFLAVGQGCLLADGAIGNRRQIGIHRHLDVEGRLVPWVVEAGQGPAGVAFLKLGDGHEVLLIVPLVGTAVKTGHLIVDHPPIIDAQGKRPCHGRGHPDRKRLFSRIEGDLRVEGGFALHDVTLPDIKVDRIQIEGFQRRGRRCRQLQPAFEGQLFQIGDNVQVIVQFAKIGHGLLP